MPTATLQKPIAVYKTTDKGISITRASGLQDVKLTALNPVLVSGNTRLYTFRQYPGLAILRLDRSTFWVHDTVHQVGIVVASWDTAEETIKQLAQEF